MPVDKRPRALIAAGRKLTAAIEAWVKEQDPVRKAELYAEKEKLREKYQMIQESGGIDKDAVLCSNSSAAQTPLTEDQGESKMTQTSESTSTESKPRAPRKPRSDKGVKRAAKKATKKPARRAAAKKTDDGRLIQPDLGHYVKHDVKTASGNRVLDVDDEVAKMLRGKDLNECFEIVAKKLTTVTKEEVSSRSLKKQYEHLNVGMQRMNIANKLRFAMRAAGKL